MDGGEVMKYSALFWPGDFVVFWNILVPGSVILNVLTLGTGSSCWCDVVLMMALALNPYVLRFLLHSPLMAWVLSMLLLIWIQKVLRRWECAPVYTRPFLRAVAMLAVFIALPSLLVRLLWPIVTEGVGSMVGSFLPFLGAREAAATRDLVLLCGATAMLLHSFFFYSQWNQQPHGFTAAPKCMPKKQPRCGRKGFFK